MSDTLAKASASVWQRARIPLIIYAVTLVGYLGASGNRIRKQSSDPHYVYLAKSLLEGRLALKRPPPHQNDWARVLELTLRDGRVLRGAFLKTGGPNRFKTTRGERLEIEPNQIRSRRFVYYVSFPWFPALLMLPFVAIWGLSFNDVLFNILIGALNPVLLYWLLRRLVALRLSQRSVTEDLWLVGAFAFGTVHFYSSVIGQVWYTAHVVGVALTAVYALAALGGRHPFTAGICLGFGFVTRTPIPFSAPLVVGEILRRNLRQGTQSSERSRPDAERPPLRALCRQVAWGPALRQLTMAGGPALIIAASALLLNFLRFDSPFEFGHYYLNVRWTERIQRWGLFNYHFLSRNLAVLLTLLPRILTQPPYVRISWHGLGIFVTTPLFLYVGWPKRRSPIQPWLYLAVLFPLILHLLYQNSGWLQFGYRFSLDFTVYLFALIAVGGRRLGWLARSLILVGVAINTFGAITFGRYWQFYWDSMFPVS